MHTVAMIGIATTTGTPVAVVHTFNYLLRLIFLKPALKGLQTVNTINSYMYIYIYIYIYTLYIYFIYIYIYIYQIDRSDNS